ncbi:hypothetical protein EV175_007072, partial [Coemansia sp. RSA 1933]
MFGSKRGRRASKSLHRRSTSAASGDSATSSSLDNAAQQHQMPQARMSMLPIPASSAAAGGGGGGIDPASLMRAPQGAALSTVRTSRSNSFGSGSHSSSVANTAYGGGIAAADGGAWQRAPIPLTATAATASNDDGGLVPVLYDFEGDGSRTLTVSAGDRVRVVAPDSEGSGWIEISVPHSGQQGLVPTTYVDVAAYRKPSPPSMPALPPRKQQPTTIPAAALPVLPTSPPDRIDRTDSHGSSAMSNAMSNDAAVYVVAL